MSKPHSHPHAKPPEPAPAPTPDAVPDAVPAAVSAAVAALAAHDAERATLDDMLLTPHADPAALHAQHYVVAGCEERLKAAREAAFKGPI